MPDPMDGAPVESPLLYGQTIYPPDMNLLDRMALSLALRQAHTAPHGIPLRVWRCRSHPPGIGPASWPSGYRYAQYNEERAIIMLYGRCLN